MNFFLLVTLTLELDEVTTDWFKMSRVTPTVELNEKIQ
jgi:hypothetical protein